MFSSVGGYPPGILAILGCKKHIVCMPHMSVLFASDSSRTMYVVLVYIVHIETEHLYCQSSTVHQTVVVCGCYFRGHL